MEERLKMFLRPGQILNEPGLFLLSPPPFGDIEKRRLPMGTMPWLLVHRNALEMDTTGGTGMFLKLYLATVLCAGLQDLLTMPVEGVLIILCNEVAE